MELNSDQRLRRIRHLNSWINRVASQSGILSGHGVFKRSVFIVNTLLGVLFH